MPEFEIISWERFHRDSQHLAAMLKDVASGFKKMITIARGGLIPAGVMATELNIRMVDTICMDSYSDDYRRGNLVIRKKSIFTGDGSGILVVDDIIDTGNTVSAIKSLYPKAFVVALYVKASGREMADVFVEEINRWIVLPWEPRPNIS
jgi:xanthine phosphoribosyltransferase